MIVNKFISLFSLGGGGFSGGGGYPKGGGGFGGHGGGGGFSGSLANAAGGINKFIK